MQLEKLVRINLSEYFSYSSLDQTSKIIFFPGLSNPTHPKTDHLVNYS